MDDLKDDDAGQQGGDNGADQKTRAWANRVGYSPDTSQLRRRPAQRRNVFAELGKMQQAKPPVAVPVVARPPLTIDVTNTQAIVIKKGLKGSRDKKTCLVDFAGTTMVLKGGSGDSADHVAHSDLIRSLGLKGVSAPPCRLLDGAEKTALVDHFQKGNWESKDLATSMTMVNPDGTTAGQLSELAPGQSPQSIFPSAAEEKVYQQLRQRREDIINEKRTKDVAWQAAWDELIKMSAGTMSLAAVKKHATAATSAERAAAIEALREACQKDSQQQQLDLLGEIEAGTVAAGLARLNAESTARQQGRDDMKTFASSQAGVEAFAGVAAADLLCGMDDRIMGLKFNGGNFLFDAAKGELVCIDNAKNPPLSMSAADAGAWKNFVNDCLTSADTLEDAIYHRLYGKGRGSGADVAGSAPGNYVDFDDQQAAAAKATIRLTLAKVVTTVEADPNAGQAAKDRAAYLKTRMQLEDYFRSLPALPAPPTPPAKIDMADKMARAGKSFFTSNKKDKRVDTQNIKDQLRAGTLTAAEARQKLLALEGGKPSLQNDRRSQKILYLANVAECVETMQTIAKDVNAILQTVPDALTVKGSKHLTAVLRSGITTWQTRLNDDKKMLGLFNTAWSALPDALREA